MEGVEWLPMYFLIAAPFIAILFVIFRKRWQSAESKKRTTLFLIFMLVAGALIFLMDPLLGLLLNAVWVFQQ